MDVAVNNITNICIDDNSQRAKFQPVTDTLALVFLVTLIPQIFLVWGIVLL